MKVKIALITVTYPFFDGLRVIACTVTNKGKLFTVGMYIEIPSEDIFDQDDISVDDLIKKKIIDSKRYNPDIKEDDIKLVYNDFHEKGVDSE